MTVLRGLTEKAFDRIYTDLPAGVKESAASTQGGIKLYEISFTDDCGITTINNNDSDLLVTNGRKCINIL